MHTLTTPYLKLTMHLLHNIIPSLFPHFLHHSIQHTSTSKPDIHSTTLPPHQTSNTPYLTTCLPAPNTLVKMEFLVCEGVGEGGVGCREGGLAKKGKRRGWGEGKRIRKIKKEKGRENGKLREEGRREGMYGKGRRGRRENERGRREKE